jgi:hypothetical protein
VPAFAAAAAVAAWIIVRVSNSAMGYAQHYERLRRIDRHRDGYRP